MSKMNALEMLNLIFLITHKKHCLMSALSKHKLLIFKTLFLLYTQHKNGFSKFMPLVLPQTYSPAFTYITGLKPDIFRKFTIPLAPEVMSTITHDNLLKHDPAILL